MQLMKQSVSMYVHFWLHFTGLRSQFHLIREMYRDWKYRPNTKDGLLILSKNICHLMWRTIRLFLVPDVFFRYFLATAYLHVIFEICNSLKKYALYCLMKCSAKGRKVTKLTQQLNAANSFQEMHTIANELDKLYQLDQWRKNPASGLFLYQRVQNKIEMYRRLEKENDVLGLMFSLRAGLLRKHWGLGNPKLYGVSYVGTKYMINDYMDTIVQAMNVVLRSSGNDEITKEELCTDNKLAFFSETRHAFGRSALMLSGGGALGLYHAGIVKALFEQNMLPHVISGSSAGSIVAGCVGVRTDEELPEIFRDNAINLHFFDLNITTKDREVYLPSFLHRLKAILPAATYENIETFCIVAGRFIDKRYVLDITALRDCLRSNMGDFTFREAYDRTGRIINITVTPLSQTEYPHLLNYLTAPNVLVWSASVASCAIPLIFAPVELLAKDQHGNIVPYYREGLKWSDGSVECDLPMERLSELFNVNHFIVSQVNIHYKFISGYASFGGGDILGFLKKQMKAYIKNIADFGLNTSILRFFGVGLVPLLTQSYEGDITISIAEQVSLLHMMRIVLRNPTEEEFKKIVVIGERSTWPHISRIETMCRIEFALERAVRYLRGEQALEDEKRGGTNFGRVPSFYTSPSSMNLANLGKPNTNHNLLQQNSPERSTQTTMRRNKSYNVAGAVMTMESSGPFTRNSSH